MILMKKDDVYWAASEIYFIGKNAENRRNLYAQEQQRLAEKYFNE